MIYDPLYITVTFRVLYKCGWTSSPTCVNYVKARFHYEPGKKHSLFVLLIFFALASILTARFNRRSIKETKNALFHARSGNGPLCDKLFRQLLIPSNCHTFIFLCQQRGQVVGSVIKRLEPCNFDRHDVGSKST